MRNNTQKGKSLSMRLSDEEFDVWGKAWLALGYTSRSQMIRSCVNSSISHGTHNCSPRTIERNIHLGRIAASLIELESAVTADNDNALQNPQFVEDLKAAIDHVLALKKVS